MTLSIMTLRIVTFGNMTLSMMTVSIRPLSILTLIKKTLSITKFLIMDLIATLRITGSQYHDDQHNPAQHYHSAFLY
jgi:hypothetical protein